MSDCFDLRSLRFMLRTFLRWPEGIPHPTDMVLAGFAYEGFSDSVQCMACRLRLQVWKNDDNPVIRHAQFNPDCPYLVQMYGRDYISSIWNKYALVFRRDHPQYQTYNFLVQTFRHWPSKYKHLTIALAGAGFYDIGDPKFERVVCYYCDGELPNVLSCADPMISHAFYFPNCEWLIRKKGREYIQHCRDNIF